MKAKQVITDDQKVCQKETHESKNIFFLARVPLSLFVDLQDVPSIETLCERTAKVSQYYGC